MATLVIKLTDLINTPTSGIVCIYNDRTNKSYLVYASSVVNWFTDNLKLLHDGVHSNAELQMDAPHLVFEVVEDTSKYPGHDYAKWKIGYWLNHYRNKCNWELYNTVKPLKVTPKIIVTSSRPAGSFKATVYLVLPRYRKIKIKDFERLDQAEQYLKDTDIGGMFLETIRS